MPKKIKQLFLFLIPTLVVAVIFIPLHQQSIFLTDDSDSDIPMAKIDTPAKQVKYSILPLTSCVLDQISRTPVVVTQGDGPIIASLLIHNNNVYRLEIRPPPTNAIG